MATWPQKGGGSAFSKLGTLPGYPHRCPHKKICLQSPLMPALTSHWMQQDLSRVVGFQPQC